MIAKKFRFGKKADFDRVFNSQNKFYSNNFVLRFYKTKNLNNRFSIVVSKKISKKAVVRNKIRRRVYEILRFNLEKMKISYDIIFLVKKGVVDMEYFDIEKEIFYILKKSRLL
ncbi:MAG: ribonuclease P protein component [Patescibacteria group bacterium]|nr:ribonuclease P protein component [Patescibacteria group bacterium]MDD4304658.1 ribonuclease P protein component [Patescibacteria group bacterium]MDD4695701.1 ribonuclease P protein component [Patescibacteria group bacterium]